MAKKTLVLGASLKAGRYSNIVIKRLIGKRHPVKAIGNKIGEIEGVRIETCRLDYEEIDTITLYLNPRRQLEYYDYIISLNPKRVIFNPGTENIKLVELLKENNIEVEMACSLVLLALNQY